MELNAFRLCQNIMQMAKKWMKNFPALDYGNVSTHRQWYTWVQLYNIELLSVDSESTDFRCEIRQLTLNWLVTIM